MSVSYQAPLSYNQAGYQPYPQQKKKTCAGGAITGATLGAITGGVIAAKTNPYVSKSGEVVEEFAQKAYQNFVDAGSDAIKEAHNQAKNIINKIKTIKTTDELKTLLTDNYKGLESYIQNKKQSLDEFLNNISERNLKQNKEAIKNWLEVDFKDKLQDMKNWIDACYDGGKKKFDKATTVTQEAFDAIEKAAKGGNGAKILKTAGVAGVAGAIVGWCVHNLARSIKQANAEH